MMKIRDFILFGQERYALPTHSVVQVKNESEWQDSPAPLDLGHFGLQDERNDERKRVVCVEGEGSLVALRVTGQLGALQIDDDQIVRLPQDFYPNSPAVGLILLENERLVLLLDSLRLVSLSDFDSSQAYS